MALSALLTNTSHENEEFEIDYECLRLYCSNPASAMKCVRYLGSYKGDLSIIARHVTILRKLCLMMSKTRMMRNT